MKYSSLLLLAFFLVPFGGFSQTSKILSGSTAFSVKYILGTCKGTFDAPKGSIIFNEKNPEASSFNVTISTNTFSTGNNSRDKDMKSEKYFYVSKYSEIRFKSSKVEKKDGKYLTTGTMTLKDISKNAILPFDVRKNADGSYELSSKFDVNRLDYKIGDKDWKLKDIVTVDLKTTIK